jgi:hypothetical protein
VDDLDDASDKFIDNVWIRIHTELLLYVGMCDVRIKFGYAVSGQAALTPRT